MEKILNLNRSFDVSANSSITILDIYGEGYISSFLLNKIRKNVQVIFVIDGIVTTFTSGNYGYHLMYSDKIYSTIDVPSSITNTMYCYVYDPNDVSNSNSKQYQIVRIQDNSTSIYAKLYNINFGDTNTISVSSDDIQVLFNNRISFKKNFKMIICNNTASPTSYLYRVIFNMQDYIATSTS